MHSERLKIVNYFREKIHFRRLTGKTYYKIHPRWYNLNNLKKDQSIIRWNNDAGIISITLKNQIITRL